MREERSLNEFWIRRRMARNLGPTADSSCKKLIGSMLAAFPGRRLPGPFLVTWTKAKSHRNPQNWPECGTGLSNRRDRKRRFFFTESCRHQPVRGCKETTFWTINENWKSQQCLDSGNAFIEAMIRLWVSETEDSLIGAVVMVRR